MKQMRPLLSGGAAAILTWALMPGSVPDVPTPSGQRVATGEKTASGAVSSEDLSAREPGKVRERSTGAAVAPPEENPASEAQREKIAALIEESRGRLTFVGSRGRINPAVMELAGVPARRVKALQQIVDDTWEKMSADMRGRMRDDPDPDPKTLFMGKNQLIIPASPEAGAAILAEMKSRIVATAGAEAAGIIFQCFRSGDYFADFGRYPVASCETDIRFNETPTTLREYLVLDGHRNKYGGGDQGVVIRGGALGYMESCRMGSVFSSR